MIGAMLSGLVGLGFIYLGVPAVASNETFTYVSDFGDVVRMPSIVLGLIRIFLGLWSLAFAFRAFRLITGEGEQERPQESMKSSDDGGEETQRD